MADHLFLPLLSKRDFPAPHSVGTWSVSNESALMSKIAEDIELASKAESQVVSSIPDIWARPVLFGNALFRKDATVLQEWRGLLSLIALRQMSRVQLTFKPLRLADIHNSDVLKNALEKLLPSATRWKDGRQLGWSEIILIGFPDQTMAGRTRYIGAFSPTTLVFAGAAYEGLLQQNPEVADFVDATGRLKPPASEGNSFLVKALYFWVTRLVEGVRSIADKGQRDLVDLLERWQKDLATEVKADRGTMKTLEQEFEIEELGEDAALAKHPVFANVAVAVSRRYTEEAGILTLRPSRQSAREVFVITPRLLDRERPWGGRIENAKALWGKQQTAENFIDAVFSGDHGAEYGGKKLTDAIWIRPELYFFGSTILKGSGRSTLLAPGDGSANEHFVLPLRTTLLEFFSPDELKRKLNAVVDERDGKVTVRLDLPVGPGDTKVTVERTYLEEDVRMIDAPVLDVFPRYLGKDWGRYYVLTSIGGDLEVVPCIDPRARDVVVAEKIVRQVAVPDAPPNLVTIYALSAKSPIGGDGVFPEAISIRASGGEELGLIAVPRRADNMTPDQQRWIVGIDFGTTNTNVWRWKINVTLGSLLGDPEQLNVDLNDYFLPLTKPSGEERSNLLRATFLAPARVQMPIGTAILVFPRAAADRDPERIVLKDYFAYFMSGPDVPLNVHVDFKRGESENQNENQKYFFDSLLFLIFLSSRSPDQAYQVREMEFRFTCPKLFSSEWESAFTSLWLKEIQKMRDWAFVDREAIAIGKQPGQIGKQANIAQFEPYESLEPTKTPTFLMSEGNAAGIFFSSSAVMSPKQEADTYKGTISVDVGGGTTDIAILFRDQIVFDSSIPLAGQYVAKYIWRRPALWKKLFSDGIQAALGRFAGQGDEARFGACLNFALNENSAAIQKLIAVQASDPDVVWLKKMLVLQYGSMAYFCGIACATNQAILTKVVQGSVDLYWGGKAAQFLIWMENGAFRDGAGVTSKMFSTILRNAVYSVTGTKSTGDPSKIILSPHFKSEAAGGVVVSSWDHVEGQQRKAAASSASRVVDEYVEEDSGPTERTGASVLAGDEMTLVDGKEIKPTDFLEEGKLYSAHELQLDTLKLRTLKHCLNAIDKAMGNNNYGSDSDRVMWDEGYTQRIQTGVFRDLANQAMKKVGSRQMEPVFVLEIRKYIDLLLDAEKAR